MPTISLSGVFPVLGDHGNLTVIVSGCALLAMDWPLLSAVWLGLFAAALAVTAIDEDSTVSLESAQREAL